MVGSICRCRICKYRASAAYGCTRNFKMKSKNIGVSCPSLPFPPPTPSVLSRSNCSVSCALAYVYLQKYTFLINGSHDVLAIFRINMQRIISLRFVICAVRAPTLFRRPSAGRWLGFSTGTSGAAAKISVPVSPPYVRVILCTTQVQLE